MTLNPLILTLSSIRAEYEAAGLSGIALEIAMTCEQKMVDFMAAAGPITFDVAALRELCRKYDTLKKEILDGLYDESGKESH